MIAGWNIFLFINVSPNQNVTEAARPPKEIIPASKKDFELHDIDRLNIYLDNALTDRSSDSKFNKAD